MPKSSLCWAGEVLLCIHASCHLSALLHVQMASMLVVQQRQPAAWRPQYTVWQVQAIKQPRSCWVAGPSADTRDDYNAARLLHACV